MVDRNSSAYVRVYGLIAVVAGAAGAAALLALWVYLSKGALKGPNDAFFRFARFILAPFIFMGVIAALVGFVAGVLQLVSGKSNGMVGAMLGLDRTMG